MFHKFKSRLTLGGDQYAQNSAVQESLRCLHCIGRKQRIHLLHRSVATDAQNDLMDFYVMYYYQVCSSSRYDDRAIDPLFLRLQISSVPHRYIYFASSYKTSFFFFQHISGFLCFTQTDIVNAQVLVAPRNSESL
jgi:hypothetical protein